MEDSSSKNDLPLKDDYLPFPRWQQSQLKKPVPRIVVCAICGKGGGTLMWKNGELVHHVCIIPTKGKAVPIVKLPTRRQRRAYTLAKNRILNKQAKAAKNVQRPNND